MQLCGTPTIFYCWPGLVIFSIRPARGIPSKPIDASADASRSPRTRPHIGSFAGHPGGRRYCGPPTGAFPLGTVLPRRRPSRHGASRASDSRIRVTRTPRCVLGVWDELGSNKLTWNENFPMARQCTYLTIPAVHPTMNIKLMIVCVLVLR